MDLAPALNSSASSLLIVLRASSVGSIDSGRVDDRFDRSILSLVLLLASGSCLREGSLLFFFLPTVSPFLLHPFPSSQIHVKKEKNIHASIVLVFSIDPEIYSYIYI